MKADVKNERYNLEANAKLLKALNEKADVSELSANLPQEEVEVTIKQYYLRTLGMRDPNIARETAQKACTMYFEDESQPLMHFIDKAYSELVEGSTVADSKDVYAEYTKPCYACPFGNGEGGCTTPGCQFEYEREHNLHIPTASEWVRRPDYVGD